MRIRKISQLAGYVGAVTSTYSESENDTYSCNYINNMIQPGSIEDAGNNWKKVDMGFATFYFLSGDYGTTTYAGSGWGLLTALNLPTGITFNKTKMIFSADVFANDNAIKLNIGIDDGNTQISGSWINFYGGNVNANVFYNCLLIDFS